MTPAFNLPTDRVMDSTGALELTRHARESLLVVGGGYIGLEMGTVYAELGTKVTRRRTDATAAAGGRSRPGQAAARSAEQAVRGIYLETKVASLTDKGRRHRSRLRRRRRASAPRRSAACWSRSAAGRTAPASAWKTRKVEIDRPGLRRHRRAAAHRRSAHLWPSATWRANRCSPTRPRIKARWPSKCCTASRPRFEPLAIPAVVFTDPEIAWAGLTEEQAKAEGIASRSRQVSLGRQRPGPGARPHRRARPSC